MTKKEHIEYWIRTADDDLSVADALFENKKYNWCLFISHLVLEKVIKAHIVNDTDNNIPPKIHDLVRLIKMTKLTVDNEVIGFLEEVNDFNIEARYPDYKNTFHKICTYDFTKPRFMKIKELYNWLKSNLKY